MNERGFSTMHVSCTYFRASMKTKHLALLAMMDLRINYSANDNDAVKDFFMLHPRKTEIHDLLFKVL